MTRSFIFTLYSLFLFSLNAQSIKTESIQSALRLLGNRIQLENGDSTSILPPIQVERNTYTLSFGNPISLEPELVNAWADQLLFQPHISQQFSINIQACETDTVLYSSVHFINKTDIIPCSGRPYPKACYEIVLTDFSPPIIQEEASSNLYLWILTGGVGIALLLGFRASRIWNRPTQVEDELEGEKSIKLGNSVLDQEHLQLTIGNQVTELTEKEAELLYYFFSQPNQLLLKEEILSTVWKNDAEYIGRTIDVFISKIRKKLELDSSISIQTVRGKGYKLSILN